MKNSAKYSEVFVMLMILAILVDQTRQLTSAPFRSFWQKFGTKHSLLENVRNLFHVFELESMEMFYTALLNGYRQPRLEILNADP